MNNIKWIKISIDFFDDEAIKLIEQMPEGDSLIVIWLKLLISAGKINDGGFVYFKKEFPYTEEMLATVFNRPINVIRLAIKTFEKFGMVQITNEQQIFISNWEKHQNIEGMELVKEYNRMAKRKQREKQKKLLIECQGQCQGHVKDSHETEQDTEQEQEKEKEHTQEENFSGVCVTEKEIKILIDYAKKSNARNVDAYVNALIKNGGYKKIIENAIEEEKKKREIQQRPTKIEEISDEERAKIAEIMKNFREKHLGKLN